MTDSPRALSLTSRRRAPWWLALGLLLMIGLIGALDRAEAPGNGPAAASDSESARAAAVLATFPEADKQSVLLVATRTDGAQLAPADQDSLRTLGGAAAERVGSTAGRPNLSEDARAAVLSVPVHVGADNTETAETIKTLRRAVSERLPAGLQVWVTGGPAFGADVAAAFDGADFTLLLGAESVPFA